MENTDAEASVMMTLDHEALNSMTNLKLARFKLRKIKFDEVHTEIIKQYNDPTISLVDKVQMLELSIKKLFSEANKERYLKNFDEMLVMAKANTSTSNNFLENVCQQLMKVIVGGKKRSEYNYLYGLIMSQWLSEQKGEYVPIEVQSTNQSLSTIEQLETAIFQQSELDLDQWRSFIQNKLFGYFDSDSELKDALEEFQSATEKHSKSLLKEKVESDDVRRAITSLAENLSDGYRKRLLIKMRSDDNAVSEFASSLTLLITDLAEWNWPVQGVRGIFRRNLVGKYRCFYEEDFLTAVFLEHIGLKWSYFFKHQLKFLFKVLKKKYQDDYSSKSIQCSRYEMQNELFCMASLPDEWTGQSDRFNYDDVDQIDLKSRLFYLMNTEIQLHQVLKPTVPYTVVSADIEWFGPSISHDVVRIFLQCCGVSQIWLDFFDRFLKQPIYYKPNEHIRQRQRGVPIPYSISYLFSELLLFGMDLYVYQNTQIFIYRLHDDLWLFHSQPTEIEKAWQLMNEYVQISGLKFNEQKCGSIRIQPSCPTDQMDTTSSECISLPRKEVKWGLLTLQPSGRFIVQQETMTPFLDEMKVRLTKATTILEWVNLYNRYVSFFLRNFGHCANILGMNHVEHMIETFQYFHRYVFPETNGNAVTSLTNRIIQQFPNCLSDEICEAWLYWPLNMGGLGLKNTFITLCSIRQYLALNKLTTFQQLPQKDIELYAELKAKYKKAKKDGYFRRLKKYLRANDQLISFDKYIEKRETHFKHWFAVYEDMLNITPKLAPSLRESCEEELATLRANMDEQLSNEQNRWQIDADTYIDWLYCYYGKQIQSTFNQINLIDSENVPMGLISWMKTTKIDWNKDIEEQQ